RHGLTVAVRAILQGALGHAFFPAPPELRIQCDKAMEWYERQEDRARQRHRENLEFQRLHGSPPRKTPADKARVARMYHDLKEQWRLEKFGEDRAEREATRKRLGMTPEVLARIPNAPPKSEEAA